MTVQYQIDLKNYLIDKEVIKIVPEYISRKYNLIPIFRVGDSITVAMSNPNDVVALDEIRSKTGLEVDSLMAKREDIIFAIDQYYGLSGAIDKVLEKIGQEKIVEDAKRMETEQVVIMEEEAPVVSLVNLLIEQAVRKRASDIHIEPDEKKLRIRYRVDGVLNEEPSPPVYLTQSIISRIKIMAEMDISESRKPQDGRAQVKVEERQIDLRISTMPTIFGENIVIRILDKQTALFQLEEIGFSEESLNKFSNLIKFPYGIILVTGPTGSGKTTTLYATLNKINSIEKNIITIEDPVEYQLELIRQSQVNNKAGITFANGLRSILRQDPDVIMIGEIRDLETAEIAVRSALTGHLVFSTLHTNDAAGALTRLVDMGVEQFLVSSSVISVMAQRLVRKICNKCKAPFQLSDSLLFEAEKVGFLKDQNKDIEIYRGKGCRVCGHTGYVGRLAIFELLEVNEEIRKMVMDKRPTSEIKAKACECGMKTLREDGFAKVRQGVTTLEEVLKVTHMD